MLLTKLWLVLSKLFPVHIVFPDLQRDLIEPAVKGTSNVLRSVARNRKTVRRVVFSSSIAGIQSFLVTCSSRWLFPASIRTLISCCFKIN